MQAPLTIQLHSPLELVQQLFVKLGVRSLICLNEQGHYVGMISKARWLAFLDELHEQ
jgi:chloride channel 3/4/5